MFFKRMYILKVHLGGMKKTEFNCIITGQLVRKVDLNRKIEYMKNRRA